MVQSYRPFDIDSVGCWMVGSPIQPTSIACFHKSTSDVRVTSFGKVYPFIELYGLCPIDRVFIWIGPYYGCGNFSFYEGRNIYGLTSFSLGWKRKVCILGQTFARGIAELVPGLGLALFINDFVRYHILVSSLQKKMSSESPCVGVSVDDTIICTFDEKKFEHVCVPDGISDFLGSMESVVSECTSLVKDEGCFREGVSMKKLHPDFHTPTITRLQELQNKIKEDPKFKE